MRASGQWRAQAAFVALALLVTVVGVALAMQLGAATFLVVALLVAGAVAYRSWRFAWFGYFLGINLTGVFLPAGELRLGTPLPSVAFLGLALWGMGRAGLLERRRVGLLVGAALVYLVPVGAASLFRAPVPLLSLWIYGQLVVAVVVGILVYRMVPAKVQILRAGTWAVGLITAISVIGRALAEFGMVAPGSFGVGPDLRLIGFSIETNIFAAQAVTWLALLWAARFHASRADRLLVAFMVAAILLAGTRSAWIAVAFLGCAVAWDLLRRSAWVLPVILLGLAAIPALYAGLATASTATTDGENLSLRALTLFDTGAGTGAYRVGIYQTALDDLAQWPHAILGTGANSYSQFHVVDTTNNGAEYLAMVWLATLYDGGFFALVGLVSLLLAFVVRADAHARAAVVVGVAAICATVTNIAWFQFFWVVIALAAAHAPPARATISRVQVLESSEQVDQQVGLRRAEGVR